MQIFNDEREICMLCCCCKPSANTPLFLGAQNAPNGLMENNTDNMVHLLIDAFLIDEETRCVLETISWNQNSPTFVCWSTGHDKQEQ